MLIARLALIARRPRFAGVIALGAALGLAACGGSSSSTTPATTPAPTTTVTAADASVASSSAPASAPSPVSTAGATTDPPTTPSSEAAPLAAGCSLTTSQVAEATGHDMVPAGQTCSWEATDAAPGLVEVYSSSTDRAHLTYAEGAAVSGVGDEARFDVSDALVFRVGDQYYVVQVVSIGSDVPTKDTELQLASLVVAAV